MKKNMRQIYEAVIVGHNLTTEELEAGRNFMFQLARDLRQLGPVFNLASKEAQRVANTLDDYYQARQR